MVEAHLQQPAAFLRVDGSPAGWAVTPGLTPYPAAAEAMGRRAEAIAAGEARELVWLLEHPPLYTAGVSAKPADLLAPERLPVFESGRGGQFTYHGPGQRVAYVMLDLRARRRDVHAFVSALETWIVGALATLGVAATVRPGVVGVWVEGGSPPSVQKIAAIGVRLRRWVSLHGISLNVDPDLSHFAGIVPCGIRDHGVTSLSALGAAAEMGDVDRALHASFGTVFGPTVADTAPVGS
jgi:lipoyl(octanoyl) transferase